ncbi:MAG: nuclear transport factor 2 family protein [Nocardioides sp.]|nr:nuclear transport factor 2 family protein [Nocardioides sp.]
MDREAAQAWLDRYVAAWKTYDRDDIAALFADGVVYRYHPHDDPTVGVEAVVAAWLGEGEHPGASTRDEPDTYSASYSPVAIDGDVVVATGTSTYTETPGGPVSQVFDNCFVMRFDGSGRCADFVEYYVRRRDG